MTASTETERATFEAVASDDGKWPQAIERDAKGNYLLMQTAQGWRWWQEAWQAARRAPAVPQEPTSKQVVLGAGALLGQPEHTADNRHPEWHSAVEKVRKVYLAMLAAAPQPPEAAQLDDIGVVDMAQAVDSKEAAHVQLPEAEDEPSSCAYCGQPSDEPRKPLSDAAIRDLYSEEVCWDMVAPYVIAFARSIEAAHGIKEQST